MNNQKEITIYSIMMKIEELSSRLRLQSENEMSDIDFNILLKQISTPKETGEENLPLFKNKQNYKKSLADSVDLILEGLQFVLLKECGELTELVWEYFTDEEILKELEFDYNVKDTFKSYEFDFIMDSKNLNIHPGVFSSEELLEEGITFNKFKVMEDGRIWCSVNILKSDLSKFAIQCIDNGVTKFKKMESHTLNNTVSSLF